MLVKLKFLRRDLSKRYAHDNIRILNSQTYKQNASLAQLDKHQTEMPEVPGAILTGGNILLLNF